jgi:hypothetical protein
MLGIIGLSLLLFVVLTFSAIMILVSRLVAIAADLSGAIAQGRPVGFFSLAFLSTFIAFACPFPFVRALSFFTALVGTFGVVPPAFAFFIIVVSPPSIVGCGGAVGHCRFGRRVDQLLDLEFRVPLETFVGEQFHHLVEGKGSFNAAFRTRT